LAIESSPVQVERADDLAGQLVQGLGSLPAAEGGGMREQGADRLDGRGFLGGERQAARLAEHHQVAMVVDAHHHGGTLADAGAACGRPELQCWRPAHTVHHAGQVAHPFDDPNGVGRSELRDDLGDDPRRPVRGGA
jgi:hypothetical protein